MTVPLHLAQINFYKNIQADCVVPSVDDLEKKHFTNNL